MTDSQSSGCGEHDARHRQLIERLRQRYDQLDAELDELETKLPNYAEAEQPRAKRRRRANKPKPR